MEDSYPAEAEGRSGVTVKIVVTRKDGTVEEPIFVQGEARFEPGTA